jgi:hypothetical protein
MAHLKRNLVAYLALFIALGGTSFAAATLVPANSVGTDQLKNGAVTQGKIATGAVTAAKIKGGAVTAAKLAAGAVHTANIATGAVGTAQIANGAVNVYQLGGLPVGRAYLSSGVQWDSGSQGQLFLDSASFSDGLYYILGGDLVATHAGIYQIDAGVDWSPNGAGSRFIGINVNGNCCFAGSLTPAAAGTGDTVQSTSDLLQLKVGDQVQITVKQTSGQALTIEPSQGTFLAMHWVSPS